MTHKKNQTYEQNELRQLTREDHRQLLDWYEINKRDLPWRKAVKKNGKTLADPYSVWVSEIMLQQTTVAAVVPFYERFLSRFPSADKLAAATIEEALPYWTGLGYYSRIRNLHKAAQIIHAEGFPTTASELVKLPGIGPYTANAIASIAFGEAVGVLDGNVIRVLSRRLGFETSWWNQDGRNFLQDRSNELAKMGSPEVLNQAMMELGATVCTPQKVQCPLCPWRTSCQALASKKIQSIPLAKPRKKFEIWHWKVHPQKKSQKIAMTLNTESPFLRNTWILPGQFEKLTKPPAHFELQHTITHHKIYVSLTKSRTNSEKIALENVKYVDPDDLAKANPSILLKKILDKMDG